jgi:TPR repeat protein
VRAILGRSLLIAGLSAGFIPAYASNSVTLSAQRDAQGERESAAEVSSALEDVARGDWPRALSAWTELALNGNREAPGQLCTLYFDARQGSFDVPETLSWCRKASATGDVRAIYRMGLFYFFGLGVPRNLEQAETLCTAAAAHDADVPAQFCLAAIAAENARTAERALRPSAPRPLASRATPPSGSGGAAERCASLFNQGAGPFDAAAVMRSCNEAAQGGDIGAPHILALVNLAGLGGPRDLDASERGCRISEERSAGRLSAGFCFAAIDELRTGSAAANLSEASPRATTEADPYQKDRILGAAHRTATGLTYSCREIIDWTRFEAPGLSVVRPNDRLFGKVITEYTAADFAELDRAAVTCATAVASTDGDGSLRRQFAAFRNAWNQLRAGQAGLLAERDRVNEESRQRLEQNAPRTNVIVTSTGETQQEKACFSAVQRVWLARGDATPNGVALEIQDSALSEERGNYVVRGQARVVDISAESRETRSASRFSCSFVGRTALIASSVLTPLIDSP